MSRGVGGVEFVQGLLPEWLALVLALVTQLGDVWFVSLLLGALYWTSRRESSAVTVARTLGGIGLLFTLKYLFSFPRPDRPLLPAESLPWLVRPLYEATAFADGYGFPSGHALVTTIVYVSLAGTLSIGSRRQRYLGAAAVVTVVGLSRVALGVHYLVDVVAGVALGLAFLGATSRLFDRYPRERATVAFALASCFCVTAVLASGFHVHAMLLLGAALGGLGGWACYRLATAAAARDGWAACHLAVAGMAFGPLVAAVVVFGLLSVPGLMGVVGFAVAGAIGLPIATRPERLRRFREFLAFCWTVLVWNVVRLGRRPGRE